MRAWMFHYFFYYLGVSNEHSQFIVQHEEEGSCFFNSSLPLPPVSKTVRHLRSFKDTQTLRHRHFLQRAHFCTYLAAELKPNICIKVRGLIDELKWGQKYRVFFRENAHSEVAAYM